MPTYDYFCKQCGHQLEIFQKMSDPLLKICDKCKGETLARRPGGGIGLSITGDGFYKTMYGESNNDVPKQNSGGCCPCGKTSGSCKG